MEKKGSDEEGEERKIVEKLLRPEQRKIFQSEEAVSRDEIVRQETSIWGTKPKRELQFCDPAPQASSGWIDERNEKINNKVAPADYAEMMKQLPEAKNEKIKMEGGREAEILNKYFRELSIMRMPSQNDLGTISHATGASRGRRAAAHQGGRRIKVPCRLHEILQDAAVLGQH